MQDALDHLQEGRSEEAVALLERAKEEAPERPDVQHALAVVQLNRGQAGLALEAVDAAIATLEVAQHPDANELHAHFLLTRAAAAEMTDAPDLAAKSYAEVLERIPNQAQALNGWGQLLLTTGQTEEGIKKLQQYLESSDDITEAKEAIAELVSTLERWEAQATPDPTAFLDAHRGSYCEFFDFHANRMEQQGWIAEAAKMKRNPDGSMVVSVEEDARPYAGVRVDLVNPQTGQPGMMGEEPMVVALADFEALAHTTCCFEIPSESFSVAISSQCPWDQLPIQIQFASGDAIEQADETIGAWYTDGFDGAFGTKTGGRFHFISYPISHRPHAVLYHVDMGRSERRSIDDLLERLAVLHETHPIKRVLIGRALLA